MVSKFRFDGGAACAMRQGRNYGQQQTNVFSSLDTETEHGNLIPIRS